MSKINEHQAVPLTGTERRCLRLIAMGMADEMIGKQLTMTPTEVRTIVQMAQVKLDAGNRMSAVARAIRLGLLDED